MQFYANKNKDELEHHGILGMHWGVRRYQNKDGSLKPAGRKRYDEDFTLKSEGNTLPKPIATGTYKSDGNTSAKKIRDKNKLSEKDLKNMKAKAEELKKQADEEYEKTETAKYEKEWRKKNPSSDWDDLGDDPKYQELSDKEADKLDAIDRKYADARVLSSAKNYVKNEAINGAIVSSALALPIVALATASNVAKGKSVIGPLLAGAGFIAGNTIIGAAEAPKSLQKVRDKYGV